MLRRGLRLTLLLGGLVAGFLLALVAVYALPQDRVMYNVRDSLPLMEQEGVSPTVMMHGPSFRLDNFTDALMLTMAISTRPGVLDSAMAMDIGLDSTDATRVLPLVALRQRAYNGTVVRLPYPRYWHGYQVVLRPALMVVTLGDLRYVNMLLLGLLLIAVTLRLRRLVGPAAAAAFFIALLLTGHFIAPVSLQYSNMTYMLLLAALAVSVAADGGDFTRVDLEVFLVLGALTAFFDLLTTPLLPLGIAQIVALIVVARRRGRPDLRADAMLVLRSLVAWGVGYAGSWAAKWAIGTAVLHTDVFADAAGAARLRAGLGDGGAMPLDALRLNIEALMPLLRPDAIHRLVGIGPVVAVVLVALIAGVVAAARASGVRMRSRSEIATAAAVLLVAPIPYLWYLAASNHSALHAMYTYRLQAVTIFAVLYFLGSLMRSGQAEPVPGAGRGTRRRGSRRPVRPPSADAGSTSGPAQRADAPGPGADTRWVG
ncbi:MAG TPA: hypothetical protein VF902_10775 [Coriobacteriia bacterium]